MSMFYELMMKNKSGGQTLNATIVGNLTITDNFVVSGFLSEAYQVGKNYLIMPTLFKPQSNTWEIVFKVKTPSSFKDRNKIFGNYQEGTNYDFGCVGIEVRYISGTPRFATYISFTGTEWGIRAIGNNYTVLTDTIYWVKTAFDGTQYTTSYSLDGVNWNLLYQEASINILYQDLPLLQSIGWDYYSDSSSQSATHYRSYWGGEIYMKESYIKIGNQIVWKGVI